MPHIIADIYEIEHEIGSGGGGIVYLARHLRLNKHVVLKGDKRSLTASGDALRREVDSLKNLSHTYIPQVYDFVIDNDVVYTVMDYVDGESFDKILERGTRFEQARIVAWARQLLEAVSYLHNQPPHGILHADIKPANIMLTPQDDIRLIDFNIALMLGEEGAIAVGRSFGYASPEHYGIDNTAEVSPDSKTTNSKNKKESSVRKTESETIVTAGSAETEVTSSENRSSSDSSGGKRLLDVRSDIYGIGATFYHLITGQRPNRDATKVEPIIRNHCGEALAAVIEKAIDPNPDMRYQSADEMLDGVLHLRDNDPRFLRWKRTRFVAALVLLLMFLFGGASAFAGSSLAREEQRAEAETQRAEAEMQRTEAETQRAEAEVQRAEAEIQRVEADTQRAEARLQEMYVLAGNSAEALRSGDRYGALAYALSAVPGADDSDVPYVPEAKKALADALGIYDLSDGFRPYRTVTLPSETMNLAIAPDGESFAAISLGFLSIFDTESGDLITELPAMESGLASLLFIDSNTIVYSAPSGLTAYDISAQSVIWTGYDATTISVSADCKTVAAVNRDDTTAYIYDMDGSLKAEIGFAGRQMRVAVNDRFGNPGGNIFELSNDGTLLAVSFSNGALEIFDIGDSSENIELFDESDYSYFEGGFYGSYFAFSATNDEESLFAVIDAERLVETISTVLTGKIGVFADESGVYMSYNGINVSIDPETAAQKPMSYNPRDQIAGGYCVEGSLNSPTVRISRFESHADRNIFFYDPEFAHDEARLNIGGDRLMLYTYDRFRIYDVDGNLINETGIPDAGYVYDQQYRRQDGESYLEVTYYDGTVHKYAGGDGELFAVEKIEPPDQSLYEEFFTDNLRITGPLHGTPAAYDILTGELIRELETDAYLTYVAQAGDYVITEYISADGDRYGLLLDGKTCEKLAHIPDLCDVIGERLIIDIRSSGELRETRVFDQEELIETARTAIG